jgi:2-polyprenyl-3-methyl-5-hydroxy-6-metoxy-1,4-benzoquinol methylase
MNLRQILSEFADYGNDHDISQIRENADKIRILIRQLDGMPAGPVPYPAIRKIAKKLGYGERPAARADLDYWEGEYTKRFEGKGSGPLPWENGRPNSALIELFRTFSTRPARVLELGCGDGMNSVFMAKLGCSVTGVDQSQAGLTEAERKAKLAGVECRFLQRDIFDLRLEPQEKFDFIFDRGCFHHVPIVYYEAYKSILADHLVPGGIFHLICHGPKTFFGHLPARSSLGSLEKLLAFMCMGQTESFCTKREIPEIFGDLMKVRSVQVIKDDEGRAFEFLSCVMERRRGAQSAAPSAKRSKRTSSSSAKPAARKRKR